MTLRVVPGGSVSPVLSSLPVGSIVYAKGPTGHFRYLPNRHRRFLMVGGGSGITPFLQIARRLSEDGEGEKLPSMRLVLCNSKEDDVIEAEAVADLQREGVWEVLHVISETRGRITEADLEEPEDGTLVMICGPFPFVSHVKALLEARRFKPEQIFVC